MIRATINRKFPNFKENYTDRPRAMIEGSTELLSVRMTSNDEGCVIKHDKGGGSKMPQNSMTSFMDNPRSMPFTYFESCMIKGI